MASLPYPLCHDCTANLVGMARMPYPPTICKDYSELLLSNDDLCSTWCCGGRGPPLLFYQLSHGGINTKKRSHSYMSNSFLLWCHQESNRGHKDFQSFALPTELWHQLVSLNCGCKGTNNILYLPNISESFLQKNVNYTPIYVWFV